MSCESEIERLFKELGEISPLGYSVGLHYQNAVPVILRQTFDEKWSHRYAEYGYGLRDPVIIWGYMVTGAIRWTDLTVPDPGGVLIDAGRFGLKFGLAISCGVTRSRSIAGLARGDREFSEGEMLRAAQIVRALHRESVPKKALTEAQVAALRCLAEGDRHAAAAAKLAISESALKARLNAARQRLQARTTGEALSRARERRLL